MYTNILFLKRQLQTLLHRMRADTKLLMASVLIRIHIIHLK